MTTKRTLSVPLVAHRLHDDAVLPGRPCGPAVALQVGRGEHAPVPAATPVSWPARARYLAVARRTGRAADMEPGSRQVVDAALSRPGVPRQLQDVSRGGPGRRRTPAHAGAAVPGPRLSAMHDLRTGRALPPRSCRGPGSAGKRPSGQSGGAYPERHRTSSRASAAANPQCSAGSGRVRAAPSRVGACRKQAGKEQRHARRILYVENCNSVFHLKLLYTVRPYLLVVYNLVRSRDIGGEPHDTTLDDDAKRGRRALS